MMCKRVMSVLLFCALAACADAPPTPPFRTFLQKAEDAFSLVTEGNGATLAITSRSGLGRARLVRVAEKWPDPLVIRLNLKGLEGFQMNNGAIRFETFLRASRTVPYFKMDAKHTDPPAGTLQLRMAQAEGRIDLVLPAEMVEGNPGEIAFMWIDFYR
jgi:hypothetical protein